MTRLGFVLDSGSCIGCHACTVACKSEHDVPLGVNRTWVKYVETGAFPDTDRHFSVMRCNHCDDAPCMAICPTSALFRDDPDSEISRLFASGEGKVRTPEQKTLPKVVYKGADPSTLDPLASAIAADGLIWADTTPAHSTPTPVALTAAPSRDDGADMARTVYTTQHKPTWGSMVSGYLVTKAIAAGVMLVASLQVMLGHGSEQAAVGVVPPMVAGAFLVLTGALLVGDLKQPRRFHYLLTRGNRTSWLVKGAYVLAGFAACLAAWWIAFLPLCFTELAPTIHQLLIGLANPIERVGRNRCLHDQVTFLEKFDAIDWHIGISL